MRLFVALPLTDEARHALAAIASDGLPEIPGRVVPPPNWHLTLRFVGDVDELGRDRLVGALGAAALGDAFSLRWGGLGAFPRAAKATVLWLGVAGGDVELRCLATSVEEAAQAAGLSPEERPFRSHLTLSRIRPPRDVTSLIEAAPNVEIPMRADRITLYRSHLGRGGARYEALEEFPL